MEKKLINLLPPQEQKHHALVGVLRELSNFAAIIFFSFVLTAIFLWIGNIFLYSEFVTSTEQLRSQQAVLAKLQDEGVKSRVMKLEINLKNLEIIKGEHLDLEPGFVELGKLLPSDLTLDRISFTRKDKKIEIAGHAGSRDSVLEYRRRLLDSSFFTNVNFPLANVEKAKDLKWSYRFYLKEQP